MKNSTRWLVRVGSRQLRQTRVRLPPDKPRIRLSLCHALHSTRSAEDARSSSERAKSDDLPTGQGRGKCCLPGIPTVANRPAASTTRVNLPFRTTLPPGCQPAATGVPAPLRASAARLCAGKGSTLSRYGPVVGGDGRGGAGLVRRCSRGTGVVHTLIGKLLMQP